MEFDLKDDSIRYVLRKRRKELNKSMDDLQDHLISKGTISNIEKAKGKVTPKMIEIYLEKLGLIEDEVIHLANEATKEMNEYYDQLEIIEIIIDRSYLPTAKKQLQKFQFADYYPLTPYICYLQGKICYEEKQYDQAEDYFCHAIKLCHHYRFRPKDNIVAACYAELARCKYSREHLDQAIQLVNLGLDHYDETKQKKGVKYRLLGNKVLFLLRSSQEDQAARLMDKVWPEVEKLDHSYVDYPVLNLYKFRSIILRDQNLFAEALHYCNEGRRIAKSRWSSNIGRYLDFLIIAGSIFLKQKEFQKAYDRFQLTIDSDPDFRSPRRHVEAYTYLGVLFNSKKDWQQASTHLDKAMEIEREHPNPFRLTKLLIVRGNVHYLQGQYSEALPYYQKAAHLSEKYGYKQRQYTALLKLANCFDNLNEKEKFSDCLERKFHLEKELHLKSEVEIYEV